MIITHLRLKNWCQHRELFVEFSPRSNGIVGTNGRGKSNLIKAIRVLLTGRTDSEDSFADDIMDGETSAALELGFIHDGIPGVVKRRLYRTATNTADLLWGDIKIAGITQTNAQLELMTGISAESLEKYTFVAQDKLKAILFDTSGKRMENMIAMIPEVSKSRIIRDRIDKFIASMPNIVLPYNEDNVISQLASTASELEKEQKNVTLYQLCSDALGSSDRHTSTITAYRVQTSISAKRARLSEERLSVMAVMTQRSSDWTNTENRLANYLADVPGFDSAAESAKCSYFRAFDFAAVNAANQLIDSGIAEQLDACRDGISCEEAVLLDLTGTLDTLRGELSAVGQEDLDVLKSLEKWDKISTAGSTKCPLCDSDVSEDFFVTQRAADTARAGEINARKLLATELVHAAHLEMSKQRARVATLQHNERKMAEGLAQAKTVLQTATLPEYTKADVELAEETIARMCLRKSELARAEQIKADIEVRKQRLASIDAETADLNSEFAAVTQQDYDKAEQSIRSINDTAASLAVSKAMVVKLQKQLDDLNTMWHELVKIKASQKSVDILKAKGVSMRDLLHRDKLPKYALQYYLDSLRDRLTHYLTKFGAPFTVIIDEDFGITFMKDGASPTAIRRLSGGEKSVVSTSLHMAVSDMFNGNMRLLVLDEPSQNMDEDFVTMLTGIIETASSGEDGRQLIVVTHHTNEMIGAFHNVIEL